MENSLRKQIIQKYHRITQLKLALLLFNQAIRYLELFLKTLKSKDKRKE